MSACRFGFGYGKGQHTCLHTRARQWGQTYSVLRTGRFRGRSQLPRLQTTGGNAQRAHGWVVVSPHALLHTTVEEARCLLPLVCTRACGVRPNACMHVYMRWAGQTAVRSSTYLVAREGQDFEAATSVLDLEGLQVLVMPAQHDSMVSAWCPRYAGSRCTSPPVRRTGWVARQR